MSKKLRAKILASFKGKEMMTRPGWFVIWDEWTNGKLAKELGIYTGEQKETKYPSFTIRFDWNLQKFCVSTE